MTTRHTTGRCALAGGLALLACAVAHSQQPTTFTPEQLRQDVTAIEAAIERTHRTSRIPWTQQCWACDRERPRKSRSPDERG